MIVPAGERKIAQATKKSVVLSVVKRFYVLLKSASAAIKSSPGGQRHKAFGRRGEPGYDEREKVFRIGPVVKRQGEGGGREYPS